MQTICQELEVETGYKIEIWHFVFTKMRAEDSHSSNTFIIKTMGPLIFTTLSELLKTEVGRKLLYTRCWQTSAKNAKNKHKKAFINE